MLFRSKIHSLAQFSFINDTIRYDTIRYDTILYSYSYSYSCRVFGNEKECKASGLIPTSKFATATTNSNNLNCSNLRSRYLLSTARLDPRRMHTASPQLKLQHLPEEEVIHRLVKFHRQKVKHRANGTEPTASPQSLTPHSQPAILNRSNTADTHTPKTPQMTTKDKFMPTKDCKRRSLSCLRQIPPEFIYYH